ncbi:MAG: hypothetical protein QXO32_09065 [Candidatus Bathyarchaeia archaeon]
MAHKASTIYSVDGELARKVREMIVVNPIPPDTFKKYNEWIKNKLNHQTTI